MRAIQQQEFGGPEVLRLVDLPVPRPTDNEVLIRVARAGVNFADTHARHNEYLAKQVLPLIPGSEVAGIDEATGRRVVGLCGTGGYAQYATAPAHLVFPIPDGVDDDVALALFLQGLTAWHLHRTAARVQPGESVVVISGAGGTGSLLIQLARPMGAGRVIATASQERKRALCLELGADAAVDGDEQGLAGRLVDANLGEPVGVVYDMAGGAVFDACLDALAPLGRIVVYGIASREPREVHTGRLMKRSHAIVGFWINHLLSKPALLGEALDDLYARAQRGELHAVVGATYPLAQAAQAQVDLVSRRTTGKLLLDPTA